MYMSVKNIKYSKNIKLWAQVLLTRYAQVTYSSGSFSLSSPMNTGFRSVGHRISGLGSSAGDIVETEGRLPLDNPLSMVYKFYVETKGMLINTMNQRSPV